MLFALLQELGLFTSVAIATAIYYTAHYLLNAAQKPRLITAEGSKLRHFIEQHVPAAEETYWPSFWCYHSHLLTPISNAFRQRNPKLNFYRELLSTPDGGTISVDWYDPVQLGSSLPLSFSTPIALFIPGLTGTSDAEYLRLLVPIAHSIGYRVVVVNYRGLGDTPLTSQRLYCAANHEDLEQALKHIRQLNPSVRLVAAALSMGGTVLAGYLVKAGASSLVDAAFLISVCWDFNKGAKQLRTGLLNPIVNRLLTKLLVNAAIKHQTVFSNSPHNFDFDSFHSFTSLRQFDHAFTIRIFGYPSTDVYYEAASYSDRISSVKVPTFCLNAADDMLAPEEDLPLKQLASSDNVAMLMTARGGHIGFMESGGLSIGKPTYYLERLFEQYMRALFEMKENPRSLVATE